MANSTQNQKTKRSYSRPAIRKQLTVYSDTALNAVETYMKPTMSAIYALDVILYFISDEATSDAANEMVSGIFDAKLKGFNDDISKYQQISEENELSEIEYSKEHCHEYLIYSPLCGQYIQLIKKFDLLTSLIDQLWLNGFISSKKRNKDIVKLKRHLMNVSRQVINASRTAMKLAKAQGKESDVENSIAELGIDKETMKDLTDSDQAVESIAEEVLESEELDEELVESNK